MMLVSRGITDSAKLLEELGDFGREHPAVSKTCEHDIEFVVAGKIQANSCGRVLGKDLRKLTQFDQRRIRIFKNVTLG
jgi:hypothetical protein